MYYFSIQNLSKSYPVSFPAGMKKKQRKQVLNDVSLEIYRGEMLALVGESGSGKTTLGRCLLRLTPADSGRVLYRGIDLLRLPLREFRTLRPRFQIIFQDPAQSLNPRQTVFSCLAEVVRLGRRMSRKEIARRVSELLDLVEFPPNLFDRLPGELSGGQRQRVAIARALAQKPDFLIADEPTSSLDAHLKWHIIELLLALKQRLNLTLLFITHDILQTARMADRVAVMYRGRIVEIAPTSQLFTRPLHPYTRVLMDSLSWNSEEGIFPQSAPENPAAEGCGFAGLCIAAREVCERKVPSLRRAEEKHFFACHRNYWESPVSFFTGTRQTLSEKDGF